MNPYETGDQQFSDNLAAFGSENATPEKPREDVLKRCLSAIAHERGQYTPRKTLLRRPAFLSTVGIAAAIALMMGFFQFNNSNGRVEAAVILQQLSNQIQEDPLVDITLKSVRLHGVFIDGRITASKDAAAGDLRVNCQDEADDLMEIDMAFAASADQTWMLIRKLVLPDTNVQAILAWLFPAGQEVLINLPHNEVDDFSMDLSLIDFDGLAEAVQNLISAGDSVGATVTNQRDGKILLEIPMNNANAFEAAKILHSQMAPPDLRRQFHQVVPSKGFHVSAHIGADKGKPEDVEAPAASSDDSEKNAENSTNVHDKNTLSLGFQISHHSGNESKQTPNEEEDANDGTDLDDSDHALFGSTLWMIYDPAAKLVSSLGVRDIGSDAGHIRIDFQQGAINAALLDSSRLTTAKTRIYDLASLHKLFGGHQASQEKTPD